MLGMLGISDHVEQARSMELKTVASVDGRLQIELLEIKTLSLHIGHVSRFAYFRVLSFVF